MYLIFDTETTGLALDFKKPITDFDNWPRLVQLAWQLHDKTGALVDSGNLIVKPDGFNIPFTASKIHGITTERAEAEGLPLTEVLETFSTVVAKAEYSVGHNIEFDLNVVGCEYLRCNQTNCLEEHKVIDTKNEGTAFCKIPGGRGGRFKWPKLSELYEKLFEEGFEEAHNAAADVAATARCFLELLRLGEVSPKLADLTAQEWETFKANYKGKVPKIDIEFDSNFEDAKSKKKAGGVKKKLDEATLGKYTFAHLHVHTQFSVLQSTIDINPLVDAAANEQLPAVAITDYHNLYGAFKFCEAVARKNTQIAAKNQELPPDEQQQELKGIVGCELNVCKDHQDKANKDDGFKLLLHAKNRNGFQNLSKLSSIAHTDGYYYLPRIDKEVLVQFKGDLIASTGSLYAEIPYLILNVGEDQAEQAFIWMKEQFGEDFYAQLLNHGLEEEKVVNETLIRFCEKHQVKFYPGSEVFYLNKEDSVSHDILLCIKDGEIQETPIGKGRGFRYGLPNKEYYFKPKSEAVPLYLDHPDGFKTIQEIIDKCENYSLKRDILLPKFDIPEEFVDPEDEAKGTNNGENAYLKYLTYKGAEKRYPEITPEIKERIDFELEVIEKIGYPGYFLIVQDFTTVARDMGVWVGPGRGSAAGSAVAYCIGITNVDPIKYDLLFERFLNPERVSMPDIDIDFDDEGRSRIIEWVENKYGSKQVAQIITYGTMAAKSAIRNTARVLNLPLPDADYLAKLLPDGLKLKKLVALDEEGLKKEVANNEDLAKAKEFLSVSKEKNIKGDTIRRAVVLEGALRTTGIHACGVVITPDDITNYIPICEGKGADLYLTQFDNSVAEDSGLLKMDFLGLRTLSIMKDAIAIIESRHPDVKIDPDLIPLDDVETYKLFQRAETSGIFQFESPGMKKHLKDLKPDVFEDLIAMNALYRPGPMEYIPSFIKRKHGEEEVSFDLDDMEGYLAETYGITVYQEQVMLLSQKLAGFSKGMADSLRKGMGKKKKEVIDALYPKFIEGGTDNGHDKKILDKVWKDWEAFAQYAFNKSHSTCYAYIAYQTGYLKAHYPAEYMAAVLTHNMNDLKTVTFFMEECKTIGVKVLPPDVNESRKKFTVNKEGNIRFGLAAIKGFGESAAVAIIEEREENGPFESIFDFCQRVNLRSVNRRAMEALANAGAFDSFEGTHRAQYFAQDNDLTGIEMALKYGQRTQSQMASNQASLFGGTDQEVLAEPKLPETKEWPMMEALTRELETIGFYISAHPLDLYKLEFDYLIKHQLKDLSDKPEQMTNNLLFGGLVTQKIEAISKKNTPYMRFTLQDYSGSFDFFMMGEVYAKFKGFIEKNVILSLRGSMAESKYKPGDFRFNITAVNFMNEELPKLVSGVQVDLNLNEITVETVNDLKQISTDFSGEIPMHVKVTDFEQKRSVNMNSRRAKLTVNSKLMSRLEQLNFRPSLLKKKEF